MFLFTKWAVCARIVVGISVASLTIIATSGFTIKWPVYVDANVNYCYYKYNNNNYPFNIYIHKLPIWKIINAIIHAIAVEYAAENIPHFQEPDSFLIATIVAIHGKHNNINTM